MNEKQRQKLDKDGKVLLGDVTLGEITGDLMNMGIDPFKVTLEVSPDGPVLVNTEHKDRPVWRNSDDDSAPEVVELEDAIADMLSGLGVKGIEWAEEDGTVTHSLDWDENGEVDR
jgi:hypothetical protein